MRGLKSWSNRLHPFRAYVAPHVGAWIEIGLDVYAGEDLPVAPHVGAWIEIIKEFGWQQPIVGRTSRRCVD